MRTLFSAICASLTSLVLFGTICLILWLSGSWPDPTRFAAVDCFMGKRFYSANGKFNPNKNSFVESGTNDLIYLSRDSCLIRMYSNYVEGK